LSLRQHRCLDPLEPLEHEASFPFQRGEPSTELHFGTGHRLIQQDVQNPLNLQIQACHRGLQLRRRRLRLDFGDSVPDLPVCDVWENRDWVAESRRERRPDPGLERLGVLGLQPTTSSESSGHPIDRSAPVVGPIAGLATIQTPTTDAAAKTATQ